MRRAAVRLAATFVALALVASACGDDGEVPVELTDVVVNREPVILIPPQAVAIDIDGDGTEQVSLDASRSTDLDGEVVDYRWSRGLDDLAFTPTHTADFSVGEHVVTLTVTDDDGLSDIQTMVVRVLEPYQGTAGSPLVDLWLGAELNAGDGVAQRWLDIPGNVSDPDGIASVIYSLNGEASEGLSLGPNDRRLVRDGDFVIDILRERLVEGTNTVEIRAADNLGEVTTALVQIINEPLEDVPLPGEIDWTQQGLDGLVEVIDGHWKIDGTDLVIDADSLGYDRLLGIGDVGWTDFDVEFTITIESISEDFNASTSTTPGFGMLLRWNGHNESFTPGSQPQQGFRPDGGNTDTPYGAFPFYAIELEGDDVLEMQDPNGVVRTRDFSQQVTVGRTYHFRAQAQSIVGSGGSVFLAKIWPAGLEEPAEWTVSYVAGTGPEEANAGSFVIVAHEVAARYSSVRISEVTDEDRLDDAAIQALRDAQVG
ncbi:MAG: PKD domain-containing protein [Acidimicrobiales bacterium]|nr:PKD domain-containing protein [Acidimicrobiales bacterium]